MSKIMHRYEPVNLASIVRECWKPLEATACARKLSVRWRLSDDITIECDGEKLRLVVYNILENAVTYADDEGRVSLSTSVEDGAVVLALSNSGSDLSAEESRRIFDGFWRRDVSRNRTDNGHCGLGLPLCKAIVEQLGGSIDVGGGGIFSITIRLPRDPRIEKATGHR